MIEKYLKEKNISAQRTESGLFYTIQKEGQGEKPATPTAPEPPAREGTPGVMGGCGVPGPSPFMALRAPASPATPPAQQTPSRSQNEVGAAPEPNKEKQGKGKTMKNKEKQGKNKEKQ